MEFMLGMESRPGSRSQLWRPAGGFEDFAVVGGGFFPDSRSACKRGVRHPFPGMLALVFLGLLARIRELARLQVSGRFATGRNSKNRWDLILL